MNANELADKAESMKKYGYTDGWIDEVATKLRQQQVDLKIADDYSYILERKLKEAQAEIESLKAKLSLWEEFGRQVVGTTRNEATR